MKHIDENFFKMTESNEIKSVEDMLLPNERVLWKGKPKKFSYVISKSIGMMPFALIWGLIDFAIIFSLINQGAFKDAPKFLPFFLIGFFALHLMPVWIWLGSIIKAAKEMSSIEYVITTNRIIDIRGKKQPYIASEVNLSSLQKVNLKKGFVDKLLKVGDIYISGTEKKSIVLFDIPNCEFITNKIKELIQIPDTNQKTKFYTNNHECAHCGTYFDIKERHKCPSCGAPIKKDKDGVM